MVSKSRTPAVGPGTNPKIRPLQRFRLLLEALLKTRTDRASSLAGARNSRQTLLLL